MYLNYNLPLVLTLTRLVISPILIPLLFVYLIPLNICVVNFIVAIIFLSFAATDFFDGYFARKQNIVTGLGKILDPIADKLFIDSALISLLAINRLALPYVLIFVLREVFVSGIRMVALENKFDLPVSNLGKLKTAFQVIMIFFILINSGSCFFPKVVEYVLIYATLFMSLFSAYNYFAKFIKKYRELA